MGKKVFKKSEDFPLPDSLLEAFYACVSLKICQSTDNYKESIPKMIQIYNQKIQEARELGYELPKNTISSTEYKKEFF